MPLGVSAMRGVARPERGSIMIDLVTTAPSSLMSMNWSSSWPAAAQPDAVVIGFGSSRPASVVDMSTSAIGAGSLGADVMVMRVMRCSCSRRPGRGARREAWSWARRGCRAGTVPTSAQRTRSPSNTGPSTHDRTMRVTPSSPMTGMTQVMQTPMPHAIDSSTAVWLCAPCAVAISLTACSMPIGPHA